MPHAENFAVHSQIMPWKCAPQAENFYLQTPHFVENPFQNHHFKGKMLFKFPQIDKIPPGVSEDFFQIE